MCLMVRVGLGQKRKFFECLGCIIVPHTIARGTVAEVAKKGLVNSG